jgi:hypothetical protein
MRTLQTSLIAALAILVGVYCEHAERPPRSKQGVAEIPANTLDSESASSSRRRHPIDQSVKVLRTKKKYATGRYIRREYLSIKQRRLEDEKFITFLQENKAHHEKLKKPLLHAKETFAIRDKAPASSIQGVYVKQLRRHYKTHHRADKNFIDQFVKEYRALHKQQYNLAYKRGRKRRREGEEQNWEDDIDEPGELLKVPDWGAKERRTVRYIVEGENNLEDRGIKNAKGLIRDLILGKETAEQRGQAA